MANLTFEQIELVRQIRELTEEEQKGKLEPNESFYLKQLKQKARRENLSCRHCQTPCSAYKKNIVCGDFVLTHIEDK